MPSPARTTARTLVEEFKPRLRKGVLEPLSLPAAAVVVVGEPLASQVDALRAEGLRLCLRTPYQAHELRYVVARALSDTDPRESRREPRVPCELGAGVQSEQERPAAIIPDVVPHRAGGVKPGALRPACFAFG